MRSKLILYLRRLATATPASSRIGSRAARAYSVKLSSLLNIGLVKYVELLTQKGSVRVIDGLDARVRRMLYSLDSELGSGPRNQGLAAHRRLT